MRITVIRQNTMLDQLCFEALGSDGNGVVEAALGLNPGLATTLARKAHALRLNQTLTLPDANTQTRTIATVKLWD